MKKYSRLFVFAMLVMTLLTTSCKQTTRVCLMDTIKSTGGSKATIVYDELDRPIQYNSYDANGYLNIMYKIYYHPNQQIDHVDVLTGFNLIVERYQAVFNYDGRIGAVFFMYDQFNIGNPTTVGGHFNLVYDSNGEIDSLFRYDDTNLLTQTFNLTFTNGNLVYGNEVGTNIESYFTYDNHGGGRTPLHEFYKFMMPFVPFASVNNCTQEDIYVGGV